MVLLIYPEDTTTDFLKPISQKIASLNHQVKEIRVGAGKDAHGDCLNKLEKLLPYASLIFFIGHGTDYSLFGGETSQVDKTPFLSLKDMPIFRDKNLILLSCESSALLKRTIKYSKIKKAIGFGLLATEVTEAHSTQKLRKLQIDNNTIEQFKEAIVKVIVNSLDDNIDINDIHDKIIFNINTEINYAVLEQKNRKLADLLFYMKDDITVF